MHYVSCDPYAVAAALEVLRLAEELRAEQASVRIALTSELADLLGY